MEENSNRRQASHKGCCGSSVEPPFTGFSYMIRTILKWLKRRRQFVPYAELHQYRRTPDFRNR